MNRSETDAMRESDIQEFFSQCTSSTVLIVGDVMLDRYIWGDVDRISPEAPVPVIRVDKRENRLGGAANVALNIRAMGATPLLCSVVGHDEAGELMLGRMRHQQIDTSGIVQSDERQTTVKSRILCRAHQMLRIDEERAGALPEQAQEALLTRIDSLLMQYDVQAVILQDYNKGVLTPVVISEVIRKSNARGIPVCVDPKKENFFAFEGCRLFKPNLREMNDSLNVGDLSAEIEILNTAAGALRKQADCDQIMITLSEHGVYLNENGQGHIWPAVERKVADVSGAGDTVISIAALGIGGGFESDVWVSLANLAGGQVCEKPGVAAVDAAQLLKEAMELSEASAN